MHRTYGPKHHFTHIKSDLISVQNQEAKIGILYSKALKKLYTPKNCLAFESICFSLIFVLLLLLMFLIVMVMLLLLLLLLFLLFLL